MIELRRSVGVGDPREERVDTLLEERVARVLVVIGGSRTSCRRRPASRTVDGGSRGRRSGSGWAAKARRSRPERMAGDTAHVTGGRTQSKRWICGCVRPGPQSHGVRICRVSRLSFSGPTRGPSDRDSADVCQDEPKGDARVDHGELARKRDATEGMLSILEKWTRKKWMKERA